MSSTGSDAKPQELVSVEMQQRSAGLEDQKAEQHAESIISEEQQPGVRIAEAVTLSWTKKSLAFMYICMWFMYFVQALQSNLTANLSAYITSDFQSHSLLTVVGVMTDIMSAACTMPVAKILNLWNRTVAFTLMMVISLLGLIMMASCNNIATYAAAQVFYSVGFTGLLFSVDVLTSDTSSMRNRGLAFAFTSSPFIITAFGGAPLSERFNEVNWRWGYGTVAIILPVVAVPLILNWEFAKRKAMKNHVIEKMSSGRTWSESLKYYVIEFDVLGIFLLIAGFSLLLLPFTLAESQKDKWASASIIVMIVIGAVTVVVFALYERFWSPKPFIPYHYLVDRTVFGACMCEFTYQIAYYCWASYLTSFLQVVYNTTLTEAGYINSIFDFVSPIWLLGAGWLIRYTGRFKWLLWISVPLYMMAVGLMIYFRTPGRSVGYLCMCEVFIALGGGTLILVEQVAVMAAAKHEDYAAMLSLLSLFGNMGGAVGNSISGAIWTNTLPVMLQRHLPASSVGDWEAIYDSLDVQLSYPVGSETRDAIIYAYAIAQRNMLIAGTVVMAITIVWVAFFRDIRVKNLDHIHGVVF